MSQTKVYPGIARYIKLSSILLFLISFPGCDFFNPVENLLQDEEPTCRIVYPEDNSTFAKGTIVDIEVEAADPNGNNLEVRFLLNGEGYYSTTVFPFRYAWDTDEFEDGPYEIVAQVIDIEGKKTTDTASVMISVGKPTVETLDVREVYLTSALVAGTIVSDGGTAITETGVYWGPYENPGETGEKTRINVLKDSFQTSISGLYTNSTYYFQAYAVNKLGESLGEEKAFTTLGNELGEFTDSRDGRVYKWVRIENQTWMAENLAYLPTVDELDNGSVLLSKYYVYDYNGTVVDEAKQEESYKSYGALYNFVAALNVCPAGWHLPTDAEWQELEMNLGMSQVSANTGGWRGSIEGRLMKAQSGWKNQGNGSNISDFSALPGGYRLPDNTFKFDSIYGNFWTATEHGSIQGWARYLYWNNTQVYRGPFTKDHGFSVRCVRD